MSLKRPTQEYVLTETKIDAAKANIAIACAAISYTGNSSVNRAIAHGLGSVPKLTLLIRDNLGYSGRIVKSGVISYLDHTTEGHLSVTPADSTNVYIGNASNYDHTFNSTGIAYTLVVIA